MYEDKNQIRIKVINGDPLEETLVHWDKSKNRLAFDEIGDKGFVSFHCSKQDLQRIVNMLNYVIKLNE